MIEEKLKVGWKEYGSLPKLNVDKIHIKIDTGAKTSAIHATNYKVFTKANQKWVKFSIAPYQEDDETLIHCEMPVKDQRTITSSNGQTSDRIVIETELLIGNQRQTIELTLSQREKMKFRMLLGRQAMKNMVVIPSQAHLTTQLTQS